MIPCISTTLNPFLVLITALLLASLAALQAAELKPAAGFSDHIMLQRRIEVPVWDTTTPGSTVTVKFMNQIRTATADGKGRWMVKLDELEAVSDPQEMTVKDAKEA